VADKLGRDIDRADLTIAERQTAHDVIRILAKDVEATVRAALSHSLRRSTQLPHDVALQLANDIEAVALPVLSASQVLSDDDLIDIVRRGSARKQAAIAARPEVSEPVSHALVANGHETAVTVLMRNNGARVSEESLARAIDRFPDSDGVKEGIVRREALPVGITQRLCGIVSDRLKEYLVVHHLMSPGLATEIVLQSREHATIRLSGGLSGQALEQFVRQVHRSGRLTPTLVLRALCIGDMAFFEAALAVMAGVPIGNARMLIHDPGRKGFAAIYEKSGLASDLFPVFRAAIDVIDGTSLDGEPGDVERFRSRVISRILTQVGDFDQKDLDYLVTKLGDALRAA